MVDRLVSKVTCFVSSATTAALAGFVGPRVMLTFLYYIKPKLANFYI
jgi:hypothetical protein